MDSSSLINAVSNPGQYASQPLGLDQTNQDTSLTAGGVTSNPALDNLKSIMNSGGMSSAQDFSGAGNAAFSQMSTSPNPYSGHTGPVTNQQVVAPQQQNQGYNPQTGTYRTTPTTGNTGSSDSWGNTFSNFSNGSGTMGMFDGAGANIGNFLSDTFGGAYNSDFGNTATTGQGSVNWGTSNRAFDFGNKSLTGIQAPSWSKDALGFARAAGYDTSAINQGLGLASMTGNGLFNAAAQYSGNPYIGMLNDDFSKRGIMQKGLQLGNVPYAGGVMGLMDYGQGYNNYGALGSTIGGLVAGPMGAYLGGQWGKDALGFDDQGNFTNRINDNYSGAGRDYAEASGFKVGSPEFDYAVKGFESLQRGKKNSQGQQELVDK